MANDKNNINELVTDDDDPTAELEALADTFDYFDQQEEQRVQSISELESDLKHRSETIERLQFDIEQLRARWMGLETEIRAREQLTNRLNDELENTTEKLARKAKLIKRRDRTIKSLKAEIRERNATFSSLQTELSDLERRFTQLQQEQDADDLQPVQDGDEDLQKQAGQIASATAEVRALKLQLERTESYADDLRRQLQEHSSMSDVAEDTCELLQVSLDRSVAELEELNRELDETRKSNEQLTAELEAIEERHAEEIRLIRFELGEAQETVAQHELVTEQLASDLVDTRGYRDKLEKKLARSEESSQSRIEKLEQEQRRLLENLDHARDQLQSKSEAINCLLAELAKKSQQLDSIGEIEHVIHEIDDRMSERIDERTRREKERVTRVLIGTVDGQELRFPLFKDRLTIGRTEQNDIQLKASYVSRRHAVVVTDADATRVIDWGSKNGVFVNSKRITEHFLSNGDRVAIGNAEFRYEERRRDI